jgi:hypothetical protein
MKEYSGGPEKCQFRGHVAANSQITMAWKSLYVKYHYDMVLDSNDLHGTFEWRI